MFGQRNGMKATSRGWGAGNGRARERSLYCGSSRAQFTIRKGKLPDFTRRRESPLQERLQYVCASVVIDLSDPRSDGAFAVMLFTNGSTIHQGTHCILYVLCAMRMPCWGEEPLRPSHSLPQVQNALARTLHRLRFQEYWTLYAALAAWSPSNSRLAC
jgi:hypothetical protein